MKCPGCDTDNEDGKLFCAKCGDELNPSVESATEIEAPQQPLTPAARERLHYFTKPHAPITVAAAGATHVGKNPGKPNNEDQFLVIRRSYPVHQLEVVVAFIFDGMGSYPGGEKWAAIGLAEAAACVEFQLPMYDQQYRYGVDDVTHKAIWHEPLPKWEFTTLLLESLSQENLVSAMQAANTRIIRSGLAAGLTHGQFGSTVVAGYIITDLETGRVVTNGFNAGDATISMVKDGCLTQLSKDHVNMGAVVRFLGAQTYTNDPADQKKPLKHVVMGHKFEQELWLAEDTAEEVWVLFYSDGLGKTLSPTTISASLTDEPEAVCAELINTALTIETSYAKEHGSDTAFGGDDNITVIAVRVRKVPVGMTQPAPEAPAAPQGETTDEHADQHPGESEPCSDVHEPGCNAGPEEHVPSEDRSSHGTDGRNG